jgi:hypothetical protein
MIIILEEEVADIELTEETILIIETYDFDLPSGMTTGLITAAGQLLGSDDAGSPVPIPAPTIEGQFLVARLGMNLKMGWETVDLTQLTQTAVKTSAYTAANNDHVLVNSSGASGDFAIQLPGSPANGTKVRVTLVAGHATYKVTIDRNASLVNGLTTTGRYTLRNAGASVYFEYTGSTLGWVAVRSPHTPSWSEETSSATPTICTDDVDMHKITALATAITSFTTNLTGTPREGQKLIIRIKDNGTIRAITWGASFEARGVALPTTTVASKVLTVGLMYDTVSSKWGCIASAQEA